MFIDSETAKNLELVTNNLSHGSANTLFGMRLVRGEPTDAKGLLNNCYTPMGARLLKANILQPSNGRLLPVHRRRLIHETVSAIIENRLNVIQGK